MTIADILMYNQYRSILSILTTLPEQAEAKLYHDAQRVKYPFLHKWFTSLQK